MKKVILYFPLLLLFFTGCIEIKTIVNVNNDGSGTIEESFLMSRQLIEMFTQFSSTFSMDSTAPPEKFSIFNEEEIKAHASEFGANVKYVSGGELKAGDKEGYRAIYSFMSLNDVKLNQNPGSKVGFSSSASEQSGTPRDVTFSFHKGAPSEIKINFPEFQSDSSSKTLSETTEDTSSFNEAVSMLKGFSMQFLLHVNGTITETDATYADNQDVTLMSVNLEALLADKKKLEEAKNINPQDMQQVEQFLKGISGMKIEFKNPVTVKFK